MVVATTVAHIFAMPAEDRGRGHFSSRSRLVAPIARARVESFQDPLESWSSATEAGLVPAISVVDG